MTPSPRAGRPGGPLSGRARGSEPRPYDFRQPTKLSREHIRVLQISYETFARQYTTLLTTTLRVVAQVSVLSIEQLTYDEYVASLQSPTLAAVVALEPLPGACILEFSLSTAMASVDHLLGGPGGSQPNRPLTEIESTLLRGLLDRVLRELAYALAPLVRVEPRLLALEHNPQFMQAATAAETVVVATFEMKVGSSECVASLCLPYDAVAPLLDAASAQGTSDRDRAGRAAAAAALSDRLEDVPVDVAVRFDPVRLTSREVMALVPGDVVSLRHPTSAPLSVTAADITFAAAVPGTAGRRLACLVVPTPEEESPA